MTKLVATYRLQFREGMDFKRAAALAPYLAKLGISHLYASPILLSVPGSTHGYDVASFTEIEPALGGDDDFRTLADALRAHNIGLILDFVPNHMGASPANLWWRDVLEWGERSAHASYFDIDWSAPKLLIPALPAPYGVVLKDGGFGLAYDAPDGSLSFTSGGLALPLNPQSYATLLARAEGGGFEDLANRFAIATHETSAELKDELATRTHDAACLGDLQTAIDAMTADHAAMHALHEAQIWRLAHWRAARETLTYRRFFEVTDLVGVRMEQPSVFDDTHRFICQLVGSDLIEGLRLDHVDGLADPLGYFRRLQDAVSTDGNFLLLVEKILGADEALRPEWPIAGTTGYEFIRSLGGVLTDPAGEEALTAAYETFIGESPDYGDLLIRTKRHIFSRNLAGELDILSGLAVHLAQTDLTTRDLGRDTLRRAIIEMAVALPVYRTYVDVSGTRPEDERLIAKAAEAAKAARNVEDEGAIDFIAQIWRLGFDHPAVRGEALSFVTRFQQTTGPLMAKAVEDTLFYRYNRLIGLNEVGGSPDAFGCPPASFHAEMQERLASQPYGLLATSTHDSKRGEDARARLYALSENPQSWADTVKRWSDLNTAPRVELSDGRGPSLNDEWMFYQGLVGAWPMQIDIGDKEAVGQLAERMAAFMQKAIREAKVRTTWTAPDQPYEAAVEAFVKSSLDAEANRVFLDDFNKEQARFAVAGGLNSISQTLVKLTTPGVPDIYQGAELWDLSLVDPDNRRPVDFAERERLLGTEGPATPETLLRDWRNGAIKLALIEKVLAFRQTQPDLFTIGAYKPLEVTGARARNVLAYLREREGSAVLTIVPVRATHLLGARTTPHIAPEDWGDTAVSLPAPLAGQGWTSLLTGTPVPAEDGALRLADVLRDLPVALLLGETAKA